MSKYVSVWHGYVFKASFDKANRSSLHSYRGPGLEQGIDWLGQIKENSKSLLSRMSPTLSAAPVAEVADIIQLPHSYRVRQI